METPEQEHARTIEAEALRCTENAERLLAESERDTVGGPQADVKAAQAQTWATLALAWRTAEGTFAAETGRAR